MNDWINKWAKDDYVSGFSIFAHVWRLSVSETTLKPEKGFVKISPSAHTAHNVYEKWRIWFHPIPNQHHRHHCLLASLSPSHIHAISLFLLWSLCFSFLIAATQFNYSYKVIHFPWNQLFSNSKRALKSYSYIYLTRLVFQRKRKGTKQKKKKR